MLTKLLIVRWIFLFTATISFAGCIVIPTYKTRISLKPNIEAKQDQHINNLVLLGTGTVASQIFLENLSAEMMSSFKEKGLSPEFLFIDKLPRYSSLKLEGLTNKNFDTYLVFKSSNNSYLDMTKEKFTAIGPGVSATKYGNQYSETYTVTLYQKKEKMQIIWQADLDVDFDIANHSRYKEISKLIFEELAKNNVL